MIDSVKKQKTVQELRRRESSPQGRDAETALLTKSLHSAPLMKIGYNIIMKAMCERRSV